MRRSMNGLKTPSNPIDDDTCVRERDEYKTTFRVLLWGKSIKVLSMSIVKICNN